MSSKEPEAVQCHVSNRPLYGLFPVCRKSSRFNLPCKGAATREIELGRNTVWKGVPTCQALVHLFRNQTKHSTTADGGR